ncbi:NAD(P)-dependent dehydrogenase, short-chain alcohol dehydrogenase family [Williamsia deligens]|nr:NAD(P)-dependent dehydrogenase, short-chain alcohol dehydrogenase family [Williamsia deligens]
MTSPAPSSRPLSGRTALVTGASRGIGLATATELAVRGAVVTITGRKPDALAAAQESIAAAAPDADVRTVVANTGSADDRRAAVAEAARDRGTVDILVNNTGINPVYGPLMDADLDAVRKIFDVNVVAALGFVQECFRAGMSRTGGAVVNIASTAGLRSTGVIAAYGASKAALIRLTAELAAELGPGIRVNAIAPNIVKTQFAEALYSADEQAVAARFPMKRLGTPPDVANLVAFLVDDASGWITGETVTLDGGLLAGG